MNTLTKQTLIPSALSMLFFSWSFPVLAQAPHNLSVKLQDINSQNCPLKGSGQVSFHEELSASAVKTQWKIAAQLQNISGKTILAYEVSIDAVPDHGGGVHYTARVDHYFRPALEFGPGTSQTVNVETPNWQMTPPKKEPSVPKATFKVVFAEFADGSKFGASKWGDSLSTVRQLTIQRMQDLLEEHRKSPEKGLRLGLAVALERKDTPEFTSLILNHVKGTLAGKGSDAAAGEISGLLDAAEKRRAVM